MNVTINPLRLLLQAIATKLKNDIAIKPVILPGGIDLEKEQPYNQRITIGWERITTVTEEAVGYYRSAQVVISINLSFKDLQLRDNAQDFIFHLLITLSGYQPYSNFYKLFPINAGFVGYDAATGYLNYSASFNSGFSWSEGKYPVVTPNNPELPLDYEIELQLWNSPQLSTNNEILVYETESSV